MSIVYTLFYFIAIIDVFLCSFSIMQALDSNLVIYPLSHNWLILKRLCFKPSINKIYLIKKLDLLLMVHLPMILHLVVISECDISFVYTSELRELRWISGHMPWASTIKVPSLAPSLRWCEFLQERIIFRYPFAFGCLTNRSTLLIMLHRICHGSFRNPN